MCLSDSRVHLCVCVCPYNRTCMYVWQAYVYTDHFVLAAMQPSNTYEVEQARMLSVRTQIGDMTH